MDENRIESIITKTLLNIGVSPNLKGYRYLKEGIAMIIKDNTLIENFNRTLYPMLAEKYGDNAYAIERSIRHVLEVLRNKNYSGSKKKSDIYSFGIEELTTKQFIAVIVEDIYLKTLDKEINS